MFQLRRLLSAIAGATFVLSAVAPVSAAPAPPVLAFPAQEVTTGSTDITIKGTAPVGGSVVVFLDSDLDGRFHSALDWSWYRRVQSDGTFEVPIFLHKPGAANRDLYAFTDTGSEQSAFVKLPAIVHQPGAPVAAPQVALPAPAPAPAPAVEPAPVLAADLLPAPAPVIDPAPAPVLDAALLPGGELAPGTYVCTYDTWSAPPPFGRLQSRQMGSFTLLPDGTYTWLDNGEGGAYAYDPATGGITWLGGWFADAAPEQTTFRRNSATSAQVDITWTGVYEWSCGANL